MLPDILNVPLFVLSDVMLYVITPAGTLLLGFVKFARSTVGQVVQSSIDVSVPFVTDGAILGTKQVGSASTCKINDVCVSPDTIERPIPCIENSAESRLLSKLVLNCVPIPFI